MCLTDDDDIAEKLRMLRNHGQLRGEFVVAAGNSRMTEIAAALGLAQLQRLDEIVSRRRELAALYAEGPGRRVDFQSTPHGAESNYQTFGAMLPQGHDRDAVLREARESAVSKLGFFRSQFTSSAALRGARRRCRSPSTSRRVGSRFRSIRRCETPRSRRWSEALRGVLDE